MFLKLLIFICFFIQNSRSVNILVLEEAPSPSHHLWIKSVILALVDRGFNVTSMTADYEPPTNNSRLNYIHLEKVYDSLYGSEGDSINLIEFGAQNSFMQLKSFYDASLAACRGALKSNGWQQLENYPNDFKFDLVIHDYPMGNCHLTFLSKFQNPPLVSMTAFNDISLPLAIMHGSVLTPSISTHVISKKFMSHTFCDRMHNYFIQIFDSLARTWYLQPKFDKLLRDAGKPPTFGIQTNPSQLLLFNYNPIVDVTEQLPPNIIGVGGLQIKPTKQLPKDLQVIADGSVKGLIVFSLGTNVPVHLLGETILNDLLETFERLSQYTFLCKLKIEGISLSKVPKNVIIRKWLPQNELLAHNNTKLFITHSGLLSVQEGIWNGIPMLGMPVFMDQYLNAELIKIKGIGEQLQWSEFTQDNLYKKLNQILDNYEDYMKRVQQASRLFRDQKELPLERAIWWLEWVIRNPNIKPQYRQGSELNLFQLQSIDVLFAFFLIVIIFVLCLFKFSVFLLKKFTTKSNLKLKFN